MPAMPEQSLRFGVSLSVNSLSSSSRYSRSVLPTGASAGSSHSPWLSSASPSSFAEHSMPNDSTLRTLACLILKSPGSTAPMRAHGTLTPAATFAAPHTIVSGCASPTFTWHTFSRSALGCLTTSSTSATTTLLNAGATPSSASTSSPAMVSACASSSLESAGLTQLLNQFSENFIAISLVELLEEAQIALVEQAQIVHAVAQHRQAFHAQAESETEIFFAVDVDVLQHVGMHHAAAADLQPAAVPAHVHLRRRLGEREERGPETHPQIVAFEEALQEVLHHALEIGETDLLVDPQALDLMEHRRMGGVGVDTVDAPGRDDLQRRLVRLHVAHLHRRGVGAQHMLRVDVEGVVHRARRMVLRDVQRGEVVEIAFDLRAGRDGKTQRMEQLLDALQRARHRMQAARAQAAPGQGHIQRFRRQLLLQLVLLQRIAALLQGGFDALLDLVDARACGRTFFRRQLAQAFEQGREAALLAQVFCLDLLQFCLIADDGELLQGLVEYLLEFLHR